MVGGRTRRPHGGMNQLATDPCFCKRARAGGINPVESSRSDKFNRSCQSRCRAANQALERGEGPRLGQTQRALQLIFPEPVMKADTWRRREQRRRLLMSSLLRGSGVEDAYLLPRFLPLSPAIRARTAASPGQRCRLGHRWRPWVS